MKKPLILLAAGGRFDDSGGPAMHGGYVVGDVSYGYTNNCRYLGGYQRVDIPVVRKWLLDCVADLACPTKQLRQAALGSGAFAR